MCSRGGSRNKPEVSTSNTPRTKSRSEPVLTLDDVNCSICLNIFIHPVTLPCQHTLCHSCFCRTIRINALLCPFCRCRLSVWSRRAIKERTLINHTFMRQIKKQFPASVKARLRELKREKEEEEEREDEDEEEHNSLLIRTAERTPTSVSDSSLFDEPQSTVENDDGEEAEQRPKFDGVLSQPGEIAMEYRALLQKYQPEFEREKHEQMSASEALIEKLKQEDKELESLNKQLLNSPPALRRKFFRTITKTATVNVQNKISKITPIVATKKSLGNSSRNSLSSITSASDSGIFSSVSSSSSSSSSFSRSSTSLIHSKSNDPGPSGQSNDVQLLNIYNTPSSSSASPSTLRVLGHVDVEAEKEALKRFNFMREQQEKDRKLALRLQKSLRKMDREPPSKPITRSNIRKASLRSRIAK